MKKGRNQMEKENEIKNLKAKYSKAIEVYGITEIFVMNNEVYITSNWDVPFDLIEAIEQDLI